MPPSITQIFPRYFQSLLLSTFFKFEYLLFEYSLYRRKYLKYSMSPVQYSPLFSPNSRTLTFHNFSFISSPCTIFVQSNEKFHWIHRHQWRFATVDSQVGVIIIRNSNNLFNHPRYSRNFYRSHYRKRSFFFHKVTITHAPTEIRALVNAAFTAFTTSPLYQPRYIGEVSRPKLV